MNWKDVDNLTSEAFSTLINISGRQRMLSQRIILLVLHCHMLLEHDKGDKLSTSLSLLRTTINLFITCQNNILNGNQGEKIPCIRHERLVEKLNKGGAEKLINNFIRDVESFHSDLSNAIPISQKTLDEMVLYTANPVLDCLNEITQIFESAFHEYSAYQRSDLVRQSETVLTAIQSIKKISHQMDIISINSKIVASRAGDAGKQFKVIADRLQTLNHDIVHSSDNVIEYLELVVGAEK
ncbi:MAG: methyl-accepting chemotaxis protein [Gammaproteobacteria bacterium]|nr:methyl-accepting chemotaxis protein [Gammaproteobacteria bacterium]